MSDEIEELYDYDVLRRLDEPTMFIFRPSQPTLILGGSQPLDVVDSERLGSIPLRRRRGGGGLVLLQPDDLWIDWWIPADDSRWSGDVHVSSTRAGFWWRDALGTTVPGVITVHEGALVGDVGYRVICFAGRGPGEVFVDDRKAVGVTQWRVREGIFLSTVIHAHGSGELVNFLRDVPDGILESLDHHVVSSLGITDPEALVATLGAESGPWVIRQFLLTA